MNIRTKKRKKKGSNKTNWKKKTVKKVFFPHLFLLHFWSFAECIQQQNHRQKNAHTSQQTCKNKTLSWLVCLKVSIAYDALCFEDKVLCAQIWTKLTLFKFGLFHVFLAYIRCGATMLKTIQTMNGAQTKHEKA